MKQPVKCFLEDQGCIAQALPASVWATCLCDEMPTGTRLAREESGGLFFWVSQDPNYDKAASASAVTRMLKEGMLTAAL